MLHHSFLCDSEAEPCVLSQTGIVGPQLMQRNPYAYWDLDPLSCLDRALEGGSQVNGLGAIIPAFQLSNQFKLGAVVVP